MKHFFKHDILVYGTTTRNEYNEEIFSEPREYKGRFQLKNRIFINEKKEQEDADALIYMDREVVGLAVGNKIKYKGTSCNPQDKDYRIIALKEALDDISKVHHFEVWVKEWEQ